MKFVNNKMITTSLIIFLVASFFYLAYIEQQNAKNQDWWAVYFQDPKSNALNFTIENNGPQNKFHFKISADNHKLKEADIEIAKGTKKDIPVEDIASSGKVTIQVTTEKDKKEIYKIF